MRLGIPVRVSTGQVDDINNLQNRIASRCANGLLRVLATPAYRAWIAGSIEYGLRSAARDHEEGREPPGAWVGREEHVEAPTGAEQTEDERGDHA